MNPLSQCSAGLPALLVSISFAMADTVTVEDLVRQSTAGNPALGMAAAEVAAARGERTSAGAWRNPELTVELGAKQVRDSENILQGNGLALGIQLSQTFEWPGKGTLRKAIADRNVAAAELALEQFRRALECRVRTLAADLVATETKRQLSLDAASGGDQLIKALRSRPQAGAQQLIEMRLIEGTVMDLQKTALTLEEQAAAIRSEINQLRGAPSFAALQVRRPPEPTSPPQDLKSLLATIGNNPPQVRLRALEMENAAARLRQARLSAFPDVALGPFFSREQAGDDETTLGGIVSLALPVWDRGSGAVAEARAKQAWSAAALALSQREAETEIARLHREWTTASRLLQVLSAGRIEEFRQAADLASRQFTTGALPIQLYLEMQRQFLVVAGEREDALAKVARNRASLAQFESPAPATSKSKKTKTP